MSRLNRDNYLGEIKEFTGIERNMDVKTRPKVSVIIPLYNLKHYIKEAIDSVLNQTYPKIEIIIVDDGSTDNPETVLNEYRNRIKVIRQENEGLASARNTGIKNSEGEYLVFLDADDYICPNKIETEIEILEKHPKIGWVYEKSLTIDENKRIIRKLPDIAIKPTEQPPQGKIFHKLLLENLMPVNAVMIRRKVIDVGMFDESLTSYEDWDFWIRVSAKYEVKYINKPLAFVRFRPDSMQRNTIRFCLNKIRVINKACRLYPELIYPYKHRLNKMLAYTHNSLGAEYYHKDKFKESASQFLNSISVYFFQRKVYFNLALVILKILKIPMPISWSDISLK